MESEVRLEKWKAASWAVEGFEPAHEGVWIVLVAGHY